MFDVIQRVSAIIGKDIPLHCWGVKLKTLQAGVEPPGVVSSDSGAWSGLFGREHERRRESGLSVVQYSWQVSQPRYARKVWHALASPHQEWLDFTTSSQISRANAVRHRLVDSLVEGDGIAEAYLQQLMQQEDQ